MSDVLQHYGIRGMKWGVRRFQQTVKTVASATKQASAAKPPPAYDFAALMKQNDELLKKMYADLLS